MCAVGDVAYDSRNDATRWKSIIAEYSNVFKPPGMPAEHDTVLRIKLKPGSILPYNWQHRVSATELAEVR